MIPVSLAQRFLHDSRPYGEIQRESGHRFFHLLTMLGQPDERLMECIYMAWGLSSAGGRSVVSII
jgi:hypothetical protein